MGTRTRCKAHFFAHPRTNPLANMKCIQRGEHMHTSTQKHTHQQSSYTYLTFTHQQHRQQIRRLRDTESELSAELKRIEHRMASLGNDAAELVRNVSAPLVA